jgi:hypothetical protein
MKISRAINLIILAVLIAATFWVAQNYRVILDYVAYNSAESDGVAARYSKELQLTEAGKLIFYGAYPEVDDKINFNADCNPGKNVMEFGCYYSIKNKIYLLDIKEPNLATMIDVGAGHELLHAVYARMSASEKTKINQQVEEAYSKIKDPNLDARLKSYDITEPGNRDNELHSILATEYSGLSPELEAHYKKYFNQRSMIVTWHQQNESYISGKESSLLAQKQKIEADKSSLDQLNTYMDALRRKGNIPQYNSLVPQQNNLVTSLKREIEAYNQNVSDYNEVIASLNSHTYSSYDAATIK